MRPRIRLKKNNISNHDGHLFSSEPGNVGIFQKIGFAYLGEHRSPEIGRFGGIPSQYVVPSSPRFQRRLQSHRTGGRIDGGIPGHLRRRGIQHVRASFVGGHLRGRYPHRFGAGGEQAVGIFPFLVGRFLHGYYLGYVPGLNSPRFAFVVSFVQHEKTQSTHYEPEHDEYVYIYIDSKMFIR